MRRGRGQPEGGLAGGLGNDLLWSRARAARPAPAEHRRGGGVQRRRLLQPTLNQPQRRIGAGTRALAQATDHLDRRGILGIDGREREHPQTQVADGSGERASSPKHGWTVGGPPGSHLGRGRRLVLLRAELEQPAASIAGELDLGEGYLWFDLLVAGWVRALPHPARRLILEVDAFDACGDRHPRGDPARLSLSEHDQRARGRRQANPAATICWSPYSLPLTHAAMDAGLPPICVGQSSPLRVRRAVGRMTRVGQRSTVLHPVAS